jgi:hypothetical protein
LTTLVPLMSLLEEVPDPRRAQGKLYKLPYVLLFPFSPSSLGAKHHTYWLVRPWS